MSGVVDAFNESDAVTQIKNTCDVVLNITPVEEKAGLLNMEIGGNKLNVKAFTVMCSQFAIIMRSGIPIGRTVKLIADKTTNKPLKKMLTSVASDVEAGRSLADSFAERGEKLLPANFVETIRAGESSGNLDKSFQSMYEHYDKEVKIKAKVKSALSYPAFVFVIAIAVVIVIMVKVVPTFTAIFEEQGAELPAMTQFLINMSNFFRKYWMVILGVIAAIAVAFKIYSGTETGRMNVAKLALKLPIFGNINILNGATQFANSMAIMLSAGLPMTRAISITAKVIDNYYISTEVGKLAGKIEEGKSLTDSMRENPVLPDILIDMVGVGEETGEMEETLKTIGGYYDAELQMATDAAMKKLEPAILVFLAGFAGFIVIAIYMAMFEMYGGMG